MCSVRRGKSTQAVQSTGRIDSLISVPVIFTVWQIEGSGLLKQSPHTGKATDEHWKLLYCYYCYHSGKAAKRIRPRLIFGKAILNSILSHQLTTCKKVYSTNIILLLFFNLQIERKILFYYRLWYIFMMKYLVLWNIYNYNNNKVIILFRMIYKHFFIPKQKKTFS